MIWPKGNRRPVFLGSFVNMSIHFWTNYWLVIKHCYFIKIQRHRQWHSENEQAKFLVWVRLPWRHPFLVHSSQCYDSIRHLLLASRMFKPMRWRGRGQIWVIANVWCCIRIILSLNKNIAITSKKDKKQKQKHPLPPYSLDLTICSGA